MTWAYAGQLVTVLIMGWGISEIICSILWHRKRRKIEAQDALNAKIDRFTHQYGERSEVPDDESFEAAS